MSANRSYLEERALLTSWEENERVVDLVIGVGVIDAAAFERLNV